MLISTPTIARLALRPRLWAYRYAKAGYFGLVDQRGHALLVDHRNVERRLGRRFFPTQLATAGIFPSPQLEDINGQETDHRFLRLMLARLALWLARHERSYGEPVPRGLLASTLAYVRAHTMRHLGEIVLLLIPKGR